MSHRIRTHHTVLAVVLIIAAAPSAGAEHFCPPQELLATAAGEVQDRAAPLGDNPEPKWSIAGAWRAAVPAPDHSTLFALSADGWLIQVDADGQVLERHRCETRGTMLRSADLDGDGEVELLVSDQWASSVTAISEDGTVLWKSEPTRGINDVWPVGATAGTPARVFIAHLDGLMVVNANGETAWNDTKLVIVHSACAADVQRNGRLQIAAGQGALPRGGGQLVLMDADGTNQRSAEVPIGANLVRPISADAGAVDSMLLVAGHNETAMYSAIRVNARGESLMEAVPLTQNRNDYVVSVDVSTDGRFAAFGMRTGSVLLMDLRTGALATQQESPWYAWGLGLIRGADEEVLIIADGRALSAFEVNRPQR